MGGTGRGDPVKLKLTQTEHLTRVGLMAGVALVLFVFESLLPRPLPWMKLGLGNLAVLLALLVYGVPAALAVSLVKLGVGGLVTGGLGGPAFVLAAGSGLASLLVMGAVHRAAPTAFSPVGLSILGALAHQLTQLALASALYLGRPLAWLLPVFLLSGLASGAPIGLLVYWTLQKLHRHGWLRPPRSPCQGPRIGSCPGGENVLY